MKLLIRNISVRGIAYQDIKFYVQSKRLYKIGKYTEDYPLAIKRYRRIKIIKIKNNLRKNDV